MNAISADENAVVLLVSARRVADFAAAEGVASASRGVRLCYSHLGAVLADSILQAGLSYMSVVRPRVVRILSEFPKAATMEHLVTIIDSGGAGSFLDWQHPTKIERFERLVRFAHMADIKNVTILRRKLEDESFCESLQRIHGIGPKTVDYMACLVGIESVAVDRHIRSYAQRVGLEMMDYNFLKRVFCFAADFLEISRRDFDSWVWRQESGNNETQLGWAF